MHKIISTNNLGTAWLEYCNRQLVYCKKSGDSFGLKHWLKEIEVNKVKGYYIESRFGTVYLVATKDSSKVTVPVGREGSLKVIHE